MIQFGGKPKKTSSDTKRHFTVVMGNKEHGLYVSSTPSSAAKKAVTKLCASNKSKKVEFHIREITQGSKKKTYGSYVGYIDKLKKPIELKGRIIRYKPVAKLSGKESKKMRGGGEGSPKSAKKISNKNDWKTPRPKFVIETVEDFRRKKFDPLDLVMDRTPNTNHMLYDYESGTPEGSQDRKSISFKFRKDITEEKLYEFLRDEQKKRKIMQKFVDLGIAHEATIFLDIPYIYEGNPEPIVKRVEYLKYFPPEHLASQEIPEQVDYAMMDDMRYGFSRTIRTKEDILDYFRIKRITNKKQQNTIIKHYEEYRGKPLT
jgi:hypothetical protein